MTRKSPLDVIRRLLEELHLLFHRLPSALRREEEDARVHIVTTMAQIPAESFEDDETAKQFAQDLGDWLVKNLE